MDVEEFRQLHSELIDFCQFIEYDFKLIYSYMYNGDFSESFDSLEKTTLGTIVKRLKELDSSSGELFISNDDYNFLKQMSEKRNYWCHQCYIKFYDDNKRNRVCSRLIKDHNRFQIVQKNVDAVRRHACERFRDNG